MQYILVYVCTNMWFHIISYHKTTVRQPQEVAALYIRFRGNICQKFYRVKCLSECIIQCLLTRAFRLHAAANWEFTQYATALRSAVTSHHVCRRSLFTIFSCKHNALKAGCSACIESFLSFPSWFGFLTIIVNHSGNFLCQKKLEITKKQNDIKIWT